MMELNKSWWICTMTTIFITWQTKISKITKIIQIKMPSELRWATMQARSAALSRAPRVVMESTLEACLLSPLHLAITRRRCKTQSKKSITSNNNWNRLMRTLYLTILQVLREIASKQRKFLSRIAWRLKIKSKFRKNQRKLRQLLNHIWGNAPMLWAKRSLSCWRLNLCLTSNFWSIVIKLKPLRTRKDSNKSKFKLNNNWKVFRLTYSPLNDMSMRSLRK